MVRYVPVTDGRKCLQSPVALPSKGSGPLTSHIQMKNCPKTSGKAFLQMLTLYVYSMSILSKDAFCLFKVQSLLFKNRKMYFLFERLSYRETERTLSFTGSLSKWPHFQNNLPHGWKSSKVLGHFLLLWGTHQQGSELEEEQLGNKLAPM